MYIPLNKCVTIKRCQGINVYLFREVKEGEESFLIMSDVHANDEGTMLQVSNL